MYKPTMLRSEAGRSSFWLLLWAMVFALPAGGLRAQEASAPAAMTGAESDQPRWASRSHWNFGLGVGYGVENAIPRNISHVNILIFQPQAGIIVKNWQHGPLSRFELVHEGVIGSAVHPGGVMLGTTLFLRFNFKPYKNVMPFFDPGASFMYTTMDRRVPELTGHKQFMPQGGLGVQYFYRPRRAFYIEYRYFHISNAGIQQPNPGLNGSMLTLGLRWFRR
jgi:hypothetical protein